MLPLSRWCRLSENERKEVITSLPTGDTLLQPINMPFIEKDVSLTSNLNGIYPQSQEVFEEHVRRSIFYTEKIEQFTYNPKTVRGNTSLQPWQIFELSGLLVQLQCIWHTYSADDCNIFIQQIMASKRSAYAEMLKYAKAMCEKTHLPFDSAASVVAMWSMLGSYDVDGWDACPSYRFALLWNLICKEGFPKAIDDTGKVFDDWSNKLGLSTVEEGLACTENTFKGLQRFIEKCCDICGTKRQESIFRFVNSVAKASNHMIEKFKNDPRSYVFPRLYDNCSKEFVNPIIKVIFEGGMRLESSIQEMKKKGLEVEWAEIKNEKTYIRSMIFIPTVSQHQFLDVDDALQVAMDMAIADFIISRKARARPEIQIPGREYFKFSRIKPIELIFPV